MARAADGSSVAPQPKEESLRMSAPPTPPASEPRHRRPRRFTTVQKISAAAGVAAVGAVALTTGLGAGQGEGEVRVAGGDLDAAPVAWKTAQHSPREQQASVSRQSEKAGERERAEERKAEARKKATAAKEAAAAKRAADARRTEAARAAEQKRKATEAKAEAERARERAASRSEQRSSPTGSPSASASPSAPSGPSGSPQQIAQQIIGDDAQFQCFSQIVERESGWRVDTQNASSGAYGLVQALPGSKMASAGADWRTNPATQIKWGLGYMKSTYGSPCGAWSFWQANHWY